MKYQLLLDKAIKASRLALCRQGLPNDWYVLALLGLLWLRGNHSEWEGKGGEDTQPTAGEQHVFAAEEVTIMAFSWFLPWLTGMKSLYEETVSLFPPTEALPAGQWAFGMLQTWEFWMALKYEHSS